MSLRKCTQSTHHSMSLLKANLCGIVFPLCQSERAQGREKVEATFHAGMTDSWVILNECNRMGVYYYKLHGVCHRYKSGQKHPHICHPVIIIRVWKYKNHLGALMISQKQSFPIHHGHINRNISPLYLFFFWKKDPEPCELPLSAPAVSYLRNTL